MRARIFELNGVFLLLLITATLNTARAEEIRKLYHRTFPAGDSTHLSIDNRFGDINFINWDRDSLVLDAVVTIDYPSSAKGKELLKYIKVSIIREGNRIQAVTEIDEKFINKWYPRNDRKKFRIDYTVHAPACINLTVMNKYGDLFINELSGHADLQVKYGHLKINRLSRGNRKPLNTLYLAYSKGTIDQAGWLMIELKYSHLNIGHAKAIAGESKYSKVRMDRASSLVIESKYDTYNLGTLNNMVFVASYGEIKAEEVRNKLSLETRYTTVDIEHVPAGFSSVDIENAYGTVKIGIDPEASYYLKGSTSYCKIDHPEARINRIVKNGSYEVDGLIGSDPKTRSRVTVRSKYAGVYLH